MHTPASPAACLHTPASPAAWPGGPSGESTRRAVKMRENQPSGLTVGVDTSQAADHTHRAMKGPQGVTPGEHKLVYPQAWTWEDPCRPQPC